MIPQTEYLERKDHMEGCQTRMKAYRRILEQRKEKKQESRKEKGE